MTAGILLQAVEYLISTVGSLGYAGIFILMAIESTIFPLPSELVLIPAGVLASRGEMSIFLIVLMGALGSLFGSLIMYFISFSLGRKALDIIIEKYGKFMFISKDSILRSEMFFKKHGEITIFVSRLLPVVRHLISIPAGLSKMPLAKFSTYTLLGSAFWSLVLAYFGYFFGIAIAEQNMYLITLIFAALCAMLILSYVFIKRKNK